MTIMRKTSNIILWIVVAAVVLVAAYTVYNKNKPLPDSQPESRITGKSEKSSSVPKVPDFSLKDLDGKTVKLSDYRGKMVFLNFWATWCPYCIKEMPELEEANQEFLKGSDAVILTVDTAEKPDVVRKFVSQKKINLPVLLDTDGKVTEKYNIEGFPTTVIINKDGTLNGRIVGATNKETLLKKLKDTK